MMKKIKTIVILFLLCITAYAKGTPVNNTDAIRLSLLTCAPGDEIYSYFGHTAIRYEEPSKGIDWVFNYGIFNFGAPNFIFRFALGQTDYILGGMSYDRFAAEPCQRFARKPCRSVTGRNDGQKFQRVHIR